jgi:hypothetical protein
MIYKRYYFKTINKGYGDHIKMWDDKLDQQVAYLHGDVLDFLNRINELEIENTLLKASFEIEQRAGMELARKLLTK